MATLRLRSTGELEQLRAQALVRMTDTSGLAFRIQRELKSPNSLLGRHWREKHRERKLWQAALTNAVVSCYGMAKAREWLSAECGLVNATGRCTTRQRVSLERLAPNRRRFIRDDDNLRFAIKPLLDALKHLGLIVDDRREWIQLAEPTQDISTDYTFWTHVTIEPLQVTDAQ